MKARWVYLCVFDVNMSRIAEDGGGDATSTTEITIETPAAAGRASGTAAAHSATAASSSAAAADAVTATRMRAFWWLLILNYRVNAIAKLMAACTVILSFGAGFFSNQGMSFGAGICGTFMIVLNEFAASSSAGGGSHGPLARTGGSQ